jgi:hypothetical protein
VTPLWNPGMTLIRFGQIVLQFDKLCSTYQIGPQLQQTVKHPVESLGKVSVHAVNLPTILVSPMTPLVNWTKLLTVKDSCTEKNVRCVVADV